MGSFVTVLNIPSPYRVHLLREMCVQVTARGHEFHAHFMYDMKNAEDAQTKIWANPQISFPHTYWKNYGRNAHYFNPGLALHLFRKPPDYLIVGSAYDTFTGMVLAMTCNAGRKCCWCEGNSKYMGKMDGFIGKTKRRILSKFDYAAVPGIEGERYILAHQAKTSLRMPKCLMLPNLIDETRFIPREDWRQENILSIRNEVGCTKDELLCLIPARLEWCKGLVEFFSLLTPDLLHGWKILVMGSGSLKSAIEKVLVDKDLVNYVIIKELIPYERMPEFYVAADLFLLPSLKDQNPLSVVEALHAGLPIALSDMAGNVHEAVSEGKNGWRLPVNDHIKFKSVLNEVFSSRPERLREMGKWSKTYNSRFWGTKHAVSSFLDQFIVG